MPFSPPCLCLFGPLRVETGEEALAIPVGKPAQVLIRLALTRRRLSREELCNCIWPLEDLEVARGRLRAALAELRRLPGGHAWIDAERTDVALNSAAIDTDVQHIQAGMKRLALATPTERRDLLERLAGKVADEPLPQYRVEWLSAHRMELLDLAFAIGRELVAARIDAGDVAGGIAAASQLIIRSVPEDESVLRALRAGKEAELLAAAARLGDQYVERLRTDLSAIPGPEVMRALSRLRATSAAPSTIEPYSDEGRHRIPVGLSELIGREATIFHLQDRLRTHRLVTITGVGGIGKTSVALATGNHVRATFPNGSGFLDLSALSAETQLDKALLECLGDAQSDAQDTNLRFARAIGAQPFLLVIDNCEHLLETVVPFVRTILQRHPSLRILATSREPLEISGESVYVLPPLQLPDREAADPRESAAVRMLCQRIRNVAPLADLSDTEGLVAISRTVDGIPLALELAAAQTRYLSVRDLSQRIQREVLNMGSKRPDSSGRQTLRDTLRWSYHLLSDEERRVFRSLAVFNGTFAGEMAGSISGASEDVIWRLVDKSLVVAHPHPLLGMRFGLLQIVRQFAMELAESAAETPLFRARLQQELLNLSEDGVNKVRGFAQSHWLARFEADQPTFRECYEHALKDPVQGAIPIVLASRLSGVWRLRGLLQESRELFRRALEFEPDQQPLEDRAEVFRALANVQMQMAEFDDAEIAARSALAIREAMSDWLGIATALSTLGVAKSERGALTEAHDLYQQALIISERENDSIMIGTLLNNLGSVTRNLGDLETAETLLNRAIEVNSSIGNQFGEATNRINRGEIALEKQDLDASQSQYGLAFHIYRAIDNGRGLSWAVDGIGKVEIARQRAPEATQLFGLAHRLRRQVGARYGNREESWIRAAYVAAEHALGAIRYQECWEAGERMAIDEVDGWLATS